ncbi:hypothetical protein FACS1894166_03780 [Bacilli bacterium]|nr:hypothetical protein FACS1894166_03780 [Bacilli bacterium]
MITIFIGDDEGFFTQVEQYHKHLELQHITHNFYVGKGMYHVYPIFKMPEGEAALSQIVSILNAS